METPCHSERSDTCPGRKCRGESRRYAAETLRQSAAQGDMTHLFIEYNNVGSPLISPSISSLMPIFSATLPEA